MKYNILIGGYAGQGMDTLGILLEKILKRKGYHVFSNKDYMSRIRGGHNFTQIRFGTQPVWGHDPRLDVIIALDQNTIDIHMERLGEGGVLLCDQDMGSPDKRVIQLPMKDIAKEIGNPRVMGSVAIGALIKILGISLDRVEEVFGERFEKETMDSNLRAFKQGYGQVEKHFEAQGAGEDNHILLNTNQAIALGALAGGVSFCAAYPMTPSTSIMTYLAQKQKDAGILVEQAEDEIAAVNMAIGASYAGARVMTATSGGGFSLMTEALGLAAIQETPLVVVNIQRPGPATGLPTRTEQSDLSFVLTASHGEFARMVISVRNPEDAFYQTVRALNLADKYQTVVILLGDQYLADATRTTPPFDFDRVRIERYIHDGKGLQPGEYKRYQPVEEGVSPRLIPGKVPGQVVIASSDEHNEYGRITESAEVRVAMMDKRMSKLKGLRRELLEPDYFGPQQPTHLLVGWGSLYGPLREAVEVLGAQGVSIGALVFGDLYPLPEERLRRYAKGAKNIINVEQNYTGQLAKLIRQETGILCNRSILKYDGRQMHYRDIIEELQGEVL